MSRSELRRLFPLIRFPAIILLIGGMVVWSELGLNAIAASISQRLFFSGRLEESARFETEVNRFFEVSDVHPLISLGMIGLFLGACIGFLAFIFRTGYKLRP